MGETARTSAIIGLIIGVCAGYILAKKQKWDMFLTIFACAFVGIMAGKAIGYKIKAIEDARKFPQRPVDVRQA